LVELIISSVVIPDYLCGFFFWLDIVSILSMFLDIHWINIVILSSLGNNSDGAGAVGAVQITKAGRGAKIGSRAIRVLRILRLVR